MNHYNQVLGEARPKDGKTLSFVGILPDKLLEAVKEPPDTCGRRGIDLCAASVLLALRAKWRTGEVSRSNRKAIKTMLGLGRTKWHQVVTLGCDAKLWRDGSTLELDNYTHRKGRAGESYFTPMDRRAVFELAEQHHLSPNALRVYLNLVVRQWGHSLKETTLTGMARELHVAHRTLRQALYELAKVGLCEFSFRQGEKGHISVDGDILRANTAELYSSKKHEKSISAQIAEQLWRGLDMRDTPPSLKTHVRRILELGIGGDELVDRVVAMGSLAGAERPVAVVIKRLTVIGAELRQLANLREQRSIERQQVPTPIEKEEDPAMLKYLQVKEVLGPIRTQQIEDALVDANRRRRGAFLPGLILVAKWANEQESRYPELTLSEALHQAMNTISNLIEVSN